MIDEADLPEGFVASGDERLTLVADRRREDEIRQAGLGSPEGWQRHLTARPGPSEAGRGRTARIDLPSGHAVRIKRLRRGGWAASLWGDRFAGRRRIVENLHLPVVARSRGVPTPAPVALLIQRDTARTVGAWLAVEEIEGAVDLRSWLVSRPPDAAVLHAALDVVRSMHDRGIEHRDLNCGNLLIREGEPPKGFVIDLDKARLHRGPLGFRLRQRALRRLERSYVKCCHPGPASERVRRDIYDGYSSGDAVLAGRLRRGRRTGRILIGIHRLGWGR